MIAMRLFLLSIILTDAALSEEKNYSKEIAKRETHASCDEDWYLFEDMCYRAGDTKVWKLTWKKASEHCKELGGSLASIHSQEVSDFLTAFILMNVQDYAWIGLNDRDNEFMYAWDDGTYLDYKNWGPGEPSHLRYENCVELIFSRSPGRWNVQKCDFYNKFICQKKAKKQAKNYVDPRLCSDGGWKLRTSCFHVVERKLTWQEAEDYCIDTHGGHLVTINDFSVIIFLEHVLRNYTDDMWIGIKMKNEFRQQWSSGWYVSFTNWMDESHAFLKEKCAVRNASGKWEKMPCKSIMPFICEVATVSSNGKRIHYTTTSSSISSNTTRNHKATTTAGSSKYNYQHDGFSTKVFVGVICCGLLVIILQVIAIFYFRDRSKRHV